MNTLASLFPTSGQTFKFDWISLIFLFVLIFCVFRGVRKGFIFSLLKLCGLTVVFFLAYLLAKPMGSWIYSLNGWGDSLKDNLVTVFVNKGSNYLVSTGNDIADAYIKLRFGSDNVMNWIVSQANLNEAVYPGAELTVAEAIQSRLGSVGVPSFLQGYVMNFFMSALPESDATLSVATYLAMNVASLTFVAIGFIAIFIIGFIILFILKRFAKKLNKVKIVGPVNRLLGLLVGICVAFVDISALTALMVALSSFEPIYNFLDGILYLSNDSVYTIGKALYNENLFQVLMGYYNGLVTAITAQ